MDYHIEERAWKAIFEYVSSLKGVHTKHEEGLRKFVEGVWYILRSGCQWRLLPHKYGDWRAVHKRFKRWCDAGIWNNFLKFLSKEADLEYVMIDATVIRSHACSAGYKKGRNEALGRSKGGFTTKIHAIVDSLGQALGFALTPGQTHDVTQASALLKNFKNAHILADKGYDSDEVIEQIISQKCTPVIPPRSNRKILRDYDKHIYKERHLIECFFSKIKHFRRVFSRFDKTSIAYLSFLNIASALIWLR